MDARHVGSVLSGLFTASVHQAVRSTGHIPGGGGTRYIKKVGMLVENFEIDLYGRPIWAWLAHFLTPKRD